MTGKVTVLFQMITSTRPKVVLNRLPTLSRLEIVPETALKCSTVSHVARYVVRNSCLPLDHSARFRSRLGGKCKSFTWLTTSRLQPLEQVEPSKWFDIEYLHGEHHPFASFSFKYRSTGDLSSNIQHLIGCFAEFRLSAEP